MKITTTWKEKMVFEASDGNVSGLMDAKSPLGSDKAPTPKQWAIAGVAGCSAMDVISLMRKFREPVGKFWIDADASTTDPKQSPVTFTRIDLTFHFEGDGLNPAKALEAVTLSQTKYCGVTAMMVKHCPVYWKVVVNGLPAGDGEAKFS